MGIARGMARLLIEEAKSRPFNGTVLQLGRQDIYFSMDELNEWATKHNQPISPPADIRYVKNPWTGKNCIDDQTFFSSLGFSAVQSCDHSSYENATHVFDLNDSVPTNLKNTFDVIFDGGTLEHVFHLPNVLKNIHELLKPGGRIIHASPTSNFVDHGFYMFSPTFFHDYYAANRYKIESAFIFELTNQEQKPWHIYTYKPGAFNYLSTGGWNGNMLGTFFVATKAQDATSGIVPQQGFYQSLWKGDAGQAAPARPWWKKFLGNHPELPAPCAYY